MAEDWLSDIEEHELIVNGRLSDTDKLKSPQYLLPLALLESVVGIKGLRRLQTEQRFCAIIKAPAADWVDPIGKTLKPWGWDFSVGRTTPLKGSQVQTDTTSTQTVHHLAKGGRVLGVSQDPLNLMPSSLMTAADMVVELPQPTGAIVAAVIKRMTGTAPKGLPANLQIALGFDDICSCLRRNETAAKAVERLIKAMGNRRPADPATRDVPQVSDLHGYGEAKEWAMHLIDDLDAWRRGEIPWEELDSTVVLSSAPGLGKTTFARSLAKSTGLPLIATSVAEWFSSSPGYLDSIIKSIDAVFDQAKSSAPAIIFFDEIDAIPNRATMSPRGADWWTPVITHCLTKLDGAVSSTTDRLVVLGATNHPDKLDSALVRPGRLNRIIHIQPPDAEAMKGILAQHLGTDLAGQDLTPAAVMAAGSSGATAAMWAKAARRVARSARRPMELADLIKVIAPADRRPHDLMQHTVIHEASHAVVATVLGLGEVESISTLMKGNSGGSTVVEFLGFIPNQRVVEVVVMQMLAGRAGEEAFFGEPGMGSGGTSDSDLARATRLIGSLHVGEGLGSTLIYRGGQEDVPAVLARHPEISAAVEEHLQRLYRKCFETVEANRDRIRMVADELLRSRFIGRERFKEIMAAADAAAAPRHEDIGGNSDGR